MPPINYPLPPTGPAYIALEIHLAKGTRRRWYWVQELPPRPPAPRAFKGFIKFDGFTHRGLTTTNLQEIMQFRIQCEDEAREHELDGWERVDPPRRGRTKAPAAP